MFFRRKKAVAEPKQEPIVGEDGILYVEEGQDYNEDEYETDSDYSSIEEEEQIEEEEEGLEYEEEPYVENVAKNDNDIEEGSIGSTENDGAIDDPSDEVSVIETTTETKRDMACDINEIKEDTVEADRAPPNEEMHSEERAPLEEIIDNKVEETTPLLDTKLDQNKEEMVTGRTEKSEGIESNIDGDGETQPSTSLTEKRSLLALAAEHDRVDIIKTILQSSQPDSPTNKNDAAHLIQLLLNNKIIGNNISDDKGPFAQSHLDDIFLPPLHIAVASSSTNAASCLLRMGADPSIRPIIPTEWDGPVWNDMNSDNGGGGGFVSPKSKRKSDIAKNHWRKLDGQSAWEVAFGSRFVDKEDNENSESKGSWFGWSSNNSGNDSNQEGPLFDIAPSKLEGIKHAFTAEALRAIGSDEVHRLRELLGSGMNEPQENQDGTKDQGVEIGGKDLIGWCVEMNAERCIEMLRELYSPSSKNEDNQDKKLKSENSNEALTKIVETKEDNQDSTAAIADEEVTESNLYCLEIKLEENRVLAGSLSLVLDNLAEEVSLTQGLLHQHGSNTNSALISQVRALKETRGDVESQISEWEGRLADRIVELRMVLGWWKAKGGSKEDFVEIFDNADGSLSSQLPLSDPSDITSVEGRQSLRNRVLEKGAQVTLSESKVRKLRASIADLAEENSQNLVKVGKLGLTGAVSLARKLKEEVKEREHILQNLQQREAACRTRVCMIRNELENLTVEAPKSITEAEDQTRPAGEDSITVEDTHALIETTNTNENTAGSVLEEAVTETETEVIDEEGSIIEYVDDSDDSDVEIEYYTDSTEEEDDVVTPQSELIQKGISTALALKEEQHQFMSFKLWELLMRMVGLSKKAIKETAQSNFDDLGNLPRAMIV